MLDHCRRLSRRPLAVSVFVAVSVLVVLVAVPGVAAAAPPAGPQVKSLPEVIDGLRLWLVGIAATVATYYATVGGMRWMTASEPGDVERAKSSLRNAGIGYACALLAPVLLAVLQSIISR